MQDPAGEPLHGKENGQRTAVPRKNPILTDMDDPAGELDRLRAKEEQLNAEYPL